MPAHPSPTSVTYQRETAGISTRHLPSKNFKMPHHRPLYFPKIIFKKYIVRYERSAAGLSDERLSGSPSMKYIEATARIKPNIITSLSLTLRSLKKRRQKIEQLIQI